MTEHYDLRILGRLATAEQQQPAKDPDHDQVKQANRHEPRSCPIHAHPAKLQVTAPATSSEAVHADTRGGGRWTLLIIRGLLIRGPCRYTDLKNGLPGIATNLLSSRIRELESAGLIEREDAPPPIATTLFLLTQAGAQLQPALDAIGRWGVRYMAEPAEGDEVRGHWFAFPASFFLHGRDPDGPPVSIELPTARSPVLIALSGGSAPTRLGPARAP